MNQLLSPTNVAETAPRFACLVCHGTSGTMFARGCRDLYLGFPGLFDYLRCSGCGHVQLHPLPANLAQYYRGYPIHRQKTAFFSWLRRHTVGANYAVPLVRSATVLDFGCGDGWYLQQLAAQGLTAIGFESDPDHAGRLSRDLGVPVFSSLDDLTARHVGTIDMLTMHFVLEHLADPAAAFRLAGILLKPGGLWYFVIPSLDSLEWRLFGRAWHGFDVPRHVSYLNDATVRSLADTAGLAVERVARSGSATDFAGSMSNLVAGRYRPAVFSAFLPLGIAWSRLVPGACKQYRLRKRDAGR
jgi:SAM-dependent methyltransferase